MRQDIDCYNFSADHSRNDRIIRLELELVNFSLVITRNGSTEKEIIFDEVLVQKILNKAKEFNRSLIPICTNDALDIETVRRECGVVIEIKLDPVNSVNTFEIPL